VRAVVITGAGVAFCSGADISTPDDSGGIEIRAERCVKPTSPKQRGS